jgi:DNA-binding transcriptional MerR regulator
MVGVEVATLRNWEQRYGLVVAMRGTGRQRLYSTDDLDRLHAVKNWMDSGLSAGEAHVLVREERREPLQ